MGKVVLTDARVTINGVLSSDHVSTVTVETSKDEVDVTAMGATFRQLLAGIGDATITLSVFQDFAAGSIHATVWPLYQAGSQFPVTVRPTSAAESATNPTMTMTGIILTYNPLAGSVGDASTTDLTIRNAAQTGIVFTP